MTVTLTKNQSIKDLPRLAAGEARAAQETLSGVFDDPVVAVHQARKAIKRAHSTARLLRKADKAHSKSLNALGRRAAETLAEARDADSVEHIARAAAIDCEDRVCADRLRDEAERARADGERVDRREASRQADAVLSELAESAEDFPREQVTDEAIQAGLLRTYRRARRALDAAGTTPDAHNLHELRKRVKDWRFHAKALGPRWPGGVKKRKKKARKLADALGSHHDLSRLIARLERREDDGTKPVIALLDEQRQAAASAALKRAKKLFGDKPGRMSKRLAA